MKVIKAPKKVNYLEPLCSVFLAGSIEQGEAVEWQERVTKALEDLEGVIWNPRREVWDSTLEQDIRNKDFKQQVEWEWDAIESANLVVFYFDPNTKSPITLVELGFVTGLNYGNVLVFCPKGFWRKGNVDVVCALNNIPVYETEEEFIQALRTEIENENRFRLPLG